MQQIFKTGSISIIHKAVQYHLELTSLALPHLNEMQVQHHTHATVLLLFIMFIQAEFFAPAMLPLCWAPSVNNTL